MKKKAVICVAHPDDCVIFGFYYWFEYKNDYNWEVVYATHFANEPRAKEVREFWSSFDINVSYLEFRDDPVDLTLRVSSIDNEALSEALLSVVSDAELILTHGDIGEYRHPHHIQLHRILSNVDALKVYFAHSSKSYDMEFFHKTPKYDVLKLPLHLNVILKFHNWLGVLNGGKYKKG